MIVPRHAYDRRCVRSIKAHQRCLQVHEVPSAVFGVDDQEIETDPREDFRSDGIVEA
jgi:hypothetical protein